VPRLVLIKQYPSIDIADFWEVGEHPEEDGKPAYPAIQAGWYYGTNKESWIFLGGAFRNYFPGEVIDRGVVRVDVRQGRGERTYKHLVLHPEEYLDDSSIYVACFGRFGAHPTYPERRTKPCELRGQSHMYYANKTCQDCGEQFDENGQHPNYGFHLENWVEIGPSYERDLLDISQPDVEVLALRQTLRNRRYFLQLADGARIRIPGKPNQDETYAPNYMLSYVRRELSFEIIPEDNEPYEPIEIE